MTSFQNAMNAFYPHNNSHQSWILAKNTANNGFARQKQVNTYELIIFLNLRSVYSLILLRREFLNNMYGKQINGYYSVDIMLKRLLSFVNTLKNINHLHQRHYLISLVIQSFLCLLV